EPSSADVEWLSRVATRGDVDHARWELRYLRRSVGILIAQRDALDDRTPSEVLRALLHRLQKDPYVDDTLRELAEPQFNVRPAAEGRKNETLLGMRGASECSRGDLNPHAGEGTGF